MKDIEKISGIYKILNKVNGKYYVGSSRNIQRRWSHHRRELRSNNHYNPKLQNAWNKYGEDNFDFIVVEIVSSEKIFDIEQSYINIKGVENLYNINPKVNYWDRIGYQKTSMFGEKNPNYGKRGCLSPLFGRKHTEKSRKLMSEKLKGKVRTVEHCKRISEAAKLRYKDPTKVPNYNHTIYGFINISGKIFFGTTQEFWKTHKLQRSKVSELLHGHKKIYNGWSINLKSL